MLVSKTCEAGTQKPIIRMRRVESTEKADRNSIQGPDGNHQKHMHLMP